MKLSTILTIGSFILFATACGPSYDDYYGEDDYYYGDEEFYGEDYEDGEFAAYENEMRGAFRGENTERFPQQESFNSSNSGNGFGAQVKMQAIIDPKTGRPSSYVPLPTNWKITQSAWLGPNGTKVDYRPGGTFTPQQRQINSVDQIIQQEMIPKLKQGGVTIDGVIDLPSIANNNKRTFSQYWKAMPAQELHQVKGIEMTDPRTNTKGILIVHLILSRSQYGSFGTYYSNAMVAKTNRYEKDKKTLIHALSNIQLDRQHLAAYNQREQQKSNASWAAHNQRMRQNQSNFDSWQKTQQTLSDISDINHEGWKRRNAIQDAGHSKSINGIWEREARVNPNTGQQMNVQTGYKYYYMNEFGQYFGTNDEFYNPERDPNVNHMNWKKVRRPNNY